VGQFLKVNRIKSPTIKYGRWVVGLNIDRCTGLNAEYQAKGGEVNHLDLQWDLVHANYKKFLII